MFEAVARPGGGRRHQSLVSWYVCEEPWLVESTLLAELDLPLTLDQHSRGGFHEYLTGLRREARLRARELPVLPR